MRASRRRRREGRGGKLGHRLREDRRLRWTLAALVAAVAFGLGYLAAATLLFPGEGEAADVRLAEVPDLQGLSSEEATERLQRAGLEARVEGRIHHPELEAGTVVAHSPLAGQLARAGAPVALTLSAGPPETPVPDLAGLPPTRARQVLERLGFRVETRAVPSDVPGEGVRGTEPPAGELVRVPGEVTLLVGEGPQVVVVPDLGGRHVDDVTGILENAGLQLGTVRFDPEAPQAPGRVVTQSPPAGYSLRGGGAVSVKVAGPPAEVPGDAPAEVSGDAAGEGG